MIKECFAAFGSAARDLVKRPAALVLFASLYLLVLIACYEFIAIGVGSVALVVSAITALVAPLALILLQTAIARFASDESGVGGLAAWSLKNFWKVLLVSIPWIALSILAIYLFFKWQVHIDASNTAAVRPIVTHGPSAGSQPIPLRWPEIILAACRIFVLGVLLPLAMVHFWIASARARFGDVLKSSLRMLARAWSARSIVVYSLGMLFFGVVPYFLIFQRTQVANGWLELFMFGLRLFLAFLFSLLGWVSTISALRRISFDTREVETVRPDEGLAAPETA
jgi:hypothetical protein